MNDVSELPSIESMADDTDQAAPELEQLWRAQIESVVGQYLAGTTDYREVASMASHIGADYHGRFLIELIQNAEDQSPSNQSQVIDGSDSRLLLIRTETHLAVLNEGRPFNAKGVRSVTSLGLSSKDPEHNLGNKGVGFKAVFEISEAPEIYSSPVEAGSIWDENATRFRLEVSPFADPTFRKKIKDIVKETLESDPAREARLRELTKSDQPIEAVCAELQQVAPFKFPKPIPGGLFEERVATLGLGKASLKHVSTAIILPLLDNDRAQESVSNAIDDLIKGDYPGSVLLFLNGISRLWIIDRVQDEIFLLRRRTKKELLGLAHGALFRQVETSLSYRGRSLSSHRSTEWWYARRSLGYKGDDRSLAAAETERIQRAVESLEIANWQKVRSAHAAVALPRPDVNSEELRLLDAAGMFCIGLPTRVPTGLPAWADGPFHGKISRTDIDFQSQDYNRLILEEVARLFWAILERLKESPDVGIRREVTLNLERDEGDLSDAISADKPLHDREIVLGATGNHFLMPVQLAIPEDNDVALFETLFGDVDNLIEYGFVLPDRKLLIFGRALLESLVRDTDLTLNDSAYLEREENKLSLLEKAATGHRGDGRTFWEPFLDWISDRIDITQIQDQVILPVGETKLAAPSDGIFYKPWVVAGVEITDSQDQEADPDFSDEVIDESDMALMAGLQFFDEKCIQVREPGLRKFTSRAGRLSPRVGPVLVRSPRKVDLINAVLLPNLVQCIGERKKIESAFSILAHIADWMGELELTGRERVERSRLQVPTEDEDGTWLWRPANEVYFGDGWLESDVDQLLERAYGRRAAARLPPWKDFIDRGSENASRDDWVVRMRTVGVASCPRIIRPSGPERGYLHSYSYTQLTVVEDALCPLEAAKEYWRTWLVYLSHRGSETASGQSFVIRTPSWVDGLEDEQARAPVVRLMLLHPHSYESNLSVTVSRKNAKDSASFSSLWAYTLLKQQWPVIPTNLGDLQPQNVWRLNDDEQRSIYVKEAYLAHVEAPYNGSQRLLSALGIYSPADAPVHRILTELQSTAAQLGELELTRRRPVRALVRQLYGWLQERCQQDPEAGKKLQRLIRAPVPLLKDDILVPVDLNESATIILENDAERARHVAGPAEAYVLPLRSGRKFKALIDGLRQVLGEGRVLLTSEMPLDVDFVPDVDEPDMPLLDFLEKEFRELGIDIVTDIGVLIAFGRTLPMDPKKDQFKETWDRLRRVSLIRGRFRGNNKEGAVFDAQAEGGPALYVDRDADSASILEMSWRVVGPAHRDLWPAYVKALQSDSLEAFFHDREVSEADRDEVASVIGYSRTQLIHRLRPILLAVLQRSNPGLTTEQFLDGIETYASTNAKLAAWLDVDEVIVERVLVGIRGMLADERMVDLLPFFGLSVSDWQQSRGALGLDVIRFAESLEAFAASLSWITALLRTKIAHTYDGQSDLDELSAAVDLASEIDCPDFIATQLPSQDTQLKDVLLGIQEFLEAQPVSSASDYLSKLVHRMQRAKPQEVTQLFGRDTPQREARLYKDENEFQRGVMATEATNNLLKVANGLAKVLGEALDAEEIRKDALVSCWLDGPWANCFAALRSTRLLLLPGCPGTVQKLDSKQAFRKPRTWRDLWREFPELGVAELTTVESEITVRHMLFGQEIEETDIDSIFSQGSDGIIGAALVDAVEVNLDLLTFVNQKRPMVEPITKRPLKKKKRRGGGQASSARERERNGLLGEAYIYEQFSATLPDFDHTCWRSRNRTRYGLDADGDDGLGYDFVYTDTDGKLTGSADGPTCLIEVKATTGDATGPFPMTDNEWYVAEECYKGGQEATYIVVRVAAVVESPRIADVLVDPVRLWQENRLSIANHDLLVRSGNSIEKNSAGEKD